LGGVTCDTAFPVRGIWGDADTIYFHTDAALARWNGRELETLANWSCSPSAGGLLRITGLWGHASDEIFLSIVDVTRFAGGCGPAFLVHYDGQAFHRM
jgi:hypothetical protein